jgi:hypothetical protein
MIDAQYNAIIVFVMARTPDPRADSTPHFRSESMG